MLEVEKFVLGPLGNNTYLLADSITHRAAVIDPSFDPQIVIETAEQRGWLLEQIWLTHAHFDHIAGVPELANHREPALPVGLHPDDLILYHQGGGATKFGFHLKKGPEPSILYHHGQILELGSLKIEVRYTPGHTPGHVIFYEAESGIVFCGDLIFQQGIGRTDLPGGSYKAIINSIQTQILTLPPETRLLSGHGDPTTVGNELQSNPFL